MIAHAPSAVCGDPLPLACGRTLPGFSLAYETYGTLAPGRDNAVLVCHHLSGDAHAAGARGPSGRPGWWDAAIGPGRMLDTDRYFVVSSAVLGHGDSTGPASPDPETGRPYGLRFPVVTIADMVDAQKRLVDSLGIGRLAAAVGGCMGGQQALEWAIRHPDALARAVVVSATSATSAHTVAVFAAMRRLISSDPDWNGGDYYGGPFPSAGLANAMVAGIPLWMTREAMEERFGRRLHEREGYGYSFAPEFEVESFLEGVAERVPRRVDPNSLLYLMRAMEYFDLEREYGSLEEAVAPIEARVLLLSYRSDWRYPPAEIESLHRALASAGRDSAHIVHDSLYGHSGFLREPASCASSIEAFLGAPVRERAAPLPV